MSDEIRVALLGAGRWGRNLARNLHALDALAVVADPDPEVQAEVTANYPDVIVVGGPEEALSTDVDAVMIATPAFTHADLASWAIEVGKHVFVEKPFALTAEDAERIVKEGERAGLVVMAGHLLLYQPAIGFLREYLASGRIGRVASLYQERLNLGTVRTVENALWSLGVHDIASMLFLVGEEPDRVDTWGQPILQTSVEDDMHLHMLFPSGSAGHIHASWLWPEQRRRLTIVGTDAMVVYDERSGAVQLVRRRALDDLTVVDDGSEHLFQAEPEPLRRELEHFLTCVRSGTEPLSSGRSAIPVIRVLERSAEQLQALG